MQREAGLGSAGSAALGRDRTASPPPGLAPQAAHGWVRVVGLGSFEAVQRRLGVATTRSIRLGQVTTAGNAGMASQMTRGQSGCGVATQAE
ncbi:hypothetical protein A1D31_22615 [Bradyrhizobium liaoningense]|nr:hypothetical protein A1D31_22615 [Bradyrhizobium liaoningense]